MAAPVGYRVESVDPQGHRDIALGVWRGNLGNDAHMAAKYGWFYQDCPFGPPLLELLKHEPSDDWAGVAAAGPRRMTARGQVFTAGLLVDLAVGAAHRSLGPALALHHALISHGGGRFGLIYGFPNKRAVPVCRRVGHVHLADMVRYARVLRHRKYLGRRLPAWFAGVAGWALDHRARLQAWRQSRSGERVVGAWSDDSPEDADRLWANSEHGDEAIAVRDRTFLSWRFDANPLATVRFLVVRSRSDRRLLAWFACQVDDDLLHVRDFWSHDAVGGIAPAYVATLVAAAYAEGHAGLSVEYAGPDARLGGWRANGFVERGRRPVHGQWFLRGVAVQHSLHLTSADEDE